jgi:hybrid polyketide synthase/nonribosomal peptide synthetase ACE1
MIVFSLPYYSFHDFFSLGLFYPTDTIPFADYREPFVTLTQLERKLGAATGFISKTLQSCLMIHPATLDAAFQSILLAASAPNDGRFSSIHLPFSLHRFVVDMRMCDAGASKANRLGFDSFQLTKNSVSGDVDIIDPKSDRVIMQIEGLRCVPLAPPTINDDKILFANAAWGPLLPDASKVVFDGQTTQTERDIACQLERVSWFYMRTLTRNIPQDHTSRSESNYGPLFEYITKAREEMAARGNPWWCDEWEQDTSQDINTICDQYPRIIDFELLRALGERLSDIVTEEIMAIEIGMKDDLLKRYYQEGLGTTEFTAYLARVVAQIAFRSPHLECLEIGAGTGGATQAILREAKECFVSYTFTDVSSGFFGAAETTIGRLSKQLHFKTLDINVEPRNQGFAENSYDLVVASLVLHATVSLRQTLRNIRQLLKPGGYLVVLELQKDLPVRWTAIFGGFPGWWVGLNDGRRVSPCVDIGQWDNLLRDCGFSGCDTVTPTEDSFAKPLTVFVSQAIDDRISFLRDPLNGTNLTNKVAFNGALGDLVLMGGSHYWTSLLVNQLEARLRVKYGTIRTARTLEELDLSTLTPTTMVISLVELDRPVFCDMSKVKWEKLQRLFGRPRSILWITSGRRAIEPHANMLIGALRTARSETLGLNVQFVDVEDKEQLDAPLVEGLLLKFVVSALWQKEDHNISFLDIERELVLSPQGEMLVQRLIPNQAMNDRYNSSHRVIQKPIRIGQSHIRLCLTRHGYILQEEVNAEDTSGTDETFKEITHSMLSSVKILGRGPLFIGIGKCNTTLTQFCSLSMTNSSCAHRKKTALHSVDIPIGREEDFLILASLLCLVGDCLRGLGHGDHILVLNPSAILVKLLEANNNTEGIQITYVTTRAECPPNCLRVHPHAPDRDLDALKLSRMTVFLDLSQEGENYQLASRLLAKVPDWCKHMDLHNDKVELSDFLSPSTVLTKKVCHLFESIITETSKLLPQFTSEDLSHETKTLWDVINLKSGPTPGSTIDWTSAGEIPIQIKPVDSTPLFSAVRTYWLVGLTRSLALSLCEWMVDHGARYIVLSSRSPKIDPCWVEEMAALGAVIWIRSW